MDLSIAIAPKAFVDMKLAIDLCPVEVSGLQMVTRNGNSWYIKETIIFPQECSLGGTEFDPVAYNKYCSRLMKNGEGSQINVLRSWWHSHVYNPARFSDTDTDYIERFGKSAYEGYNPWLISIVGNKRDALRVRLDFFKPNRLAYPDVNLLIMDTVNVDDLRRLYSERKADVEQQIAEYVHIVEKDEEDEPTDTC